ncbi:3-deoxy-D-manno-octulosonic acid transferase [Rhodobacter lacus]|uniref:3-deoxy-D-manno-octulosonic acid transferase n=1 Tax=Rhodobacter lacus TaxID=1641972 RepID=A0ABW5A8G3_9RHOB
MADTGRALGAAYLAASRLLAPLAPVLLQRRLEQGREIPGRWREKLGEPGLPRPAGRLVWLHAVGLGETMALRGLIAALETRAPDLAFLVTSSTRGSAEVFARDMGATTRHQFLPLDIAPYWARFLDHWRPDLAIWSEQDLWPGAMFSAAKAGVPQALVNARMNAHSYKKRRRLAPVYRAALRQLALTDAQDAATARHLAALGAENVTVSGSLKPAGPPLGADGAELARLQARLAGRRIWLAASSHPGDEAEALAALETAPAETLLILAPRFVERRGEIAADLAARGLPCAQRSKGELPAADTRVFLADTLGEMGLWYRLAEIALIGGGFRDAIGGHNPWEAVQLGCPVLHGPDTGNFRADYAALDAAGAARPVALGGLAAAMPPPAEAAEMAARARTLVGSAQTRVADLAARLTAVMEAGPCR